jgi:hypothetical protein
MRMASIHQLSMARMLTELKMSEILQVPFEANGVAEKASSSTLPLEDVNIF